MRYKLLCIYQLSGLPLAQAAHYDTEVNRNSVCMWFFHPCILSLVTLERLASRQHVKTNFFLFVLDERVCLAHLLASTLSSSLTTWTCQPRRSMAPSPPLNSSASGWTSGDGTTAKLSVRTHAHNRFGSIEAMHQSVGRFESVCFSCGILE